MIGSSSIMEMHGVHMSESIKLDESDIIDNINIDKQNT
jgi:hypothetical protein